MSTLDRAYLVYTDGSCHAQDRIGAWAWVAVDCYDEEVMQGQAEYDTTISRMELMAAIEALEYLNRAWGSCTVLLFSDSEYVVKGANNRRRKRNKNVDLWGYLDDAIDKHDMVVLEHVRGHNGNHHNEQADKFAGELRQAAKNADSSASNSG